jgi:hypothetical protein
MLFVRQRFEGHRYSFQYETPRVKGGPRGTYMRPDISVFKDGRLCAVIEVGSLTCQDKLEWLRLALPGVEVLRIRKEKMAGGIMWGLKRMLEECPSIREDWEVACRQFSEFIERYGGAVLSEEYADGPGSESVGDETEDGDDGKEHVLENVRK